MTLPAPMTPAGCDLRGYSFMPLFGTRLFRSKFYLLATSNPRAGIAALKLWWEAWQQVPAGSLPDDDQELALLADFGADVRSWKKARAVALHGFVLCSDGRLYHPVVSQEALHSFEARQRDNVKRATDGQRLRDWRGKQRKNPSETPDETRFETPDVNVSSQVDRDSRQRQRESSSLCSDEAPRRRRAAKNDDPVLPEWVPVDAWQGFVQMRKADGKPVGPRAQSLLLQKLARFRDQGHDPQVVLDNSTEGGWTGIYEPKGGAISTRLNAGPASKPHPSMNRTERNRAEIDRLLGASESSLPVIDGETANLTGEFE